MSEWHLSNYREAELRKFLEILPFWLYYYTNRYTHNHTYTHLLTLTYTHTHSRIHIHTHTLPKCPEIEAVCCGFTPSTPSPNIFAQLLIRQLHSFTAWERGEVVWIFIHSQRDSKNISKVNELQWNDSIVQQLWNHNCFVILVVVKNHFSRERYWGQRRNFFLFSL